MADDDQAPMTMAQNAPRGAPAKPSPAPDAKPTLGYEEIIKGAKEAEKPPADINELKDWATSLSPVHQTWAKELDIWLQKRGKKGLLDPSLDPKEREQVDKLFGASAGKWRHSKTPKSRRKPGEAAPTPGDFSPPKHPGDDQGPFKPRGELKDVPQAVGALGGMMMEEEDAA